MNNTRLSLDVIQVNNPCPQSWEQMSGDDRTRYCQGCQAPVYNLSGMTRTEAERLVCETAGRLCVRLARTQDGRVQTLEYQPPKPGGRGWRFWTAVSTCAAAVVAGANAYFLGRPAPTVVVGRPAIRVVMGDVAVPPPPAPAPAPAASPADGRADEAS